MERRRCAGCGGAFRPRPQVPDQKYCSASACQRARRRRWQRAKRQSDADYRENQARAQRAWVQGHRDYWREYRRTHPQYCESNRLAARQRQRQASSAAGGAVCKDGRVKGGFARDLSAGAGECRRVCKDGRVGRGNDFDIKIIRGSGGGLQRDDVIGAGGLSCMPIQSSPVCAIVRTVRSRLGLLSPLWWEFQNRQCQFRDDSKHFTTLAIVVNRSSGTFVRNAGHQFSRMSSCRDSLLSRLEPSMTRVGLILRCTSIATARSAGHPYPKAVKNSRRCRLEFANRHGSSPPLRVF
jgi:hypothetical protein